MKQIFLGKAKYLIVSIILIVVGIYLYTNQVSPLSTKTTPSVDQQIANWQSYSNQKYNFTFKYPDNWGIGSKERCGASWSVTELPALGPEYANSTGACPTEGSTMSFWSDSNYLKQLLGSSDLKIESSQTLVGGKKAKYLHIQNLAQDSKNRGPKGSILVVVPLSNADLVVELGDIKQQAIFNRILSTINFQNRR